MNEAVQQLTDKLQDWFTEGVRLLPNLVVAALVMAAFLLLSRSVRVVLNRLLSRLDGNTAATRLIVRASGFGVQLVGVFIVLSVLHLDKAVTSLLTGAGVLGVVLGFAFQEISTNFLSGVIIAFEKPYRVGDIVEAQGFVGTVEEIGLRATSMKTYDGLDVVVPNKYFLTEPLINLTLTNDRRFSLEVGVSYGDDLGKVKRVLEEVLASQPELLPDRPREVFATGFGDSSITFLVRAWVEFPGDVSYFRVPDAVVREIKAAFDREGITIPFPIRTLDFGIKGGEPLDAALKRAA